MAFETDAYGQEPPIRVGFGAINYSNNVIRGRVLTIFSFG